jgi:azurin
MTNDKNVSRRDFLQGLGIVGVAGLAPLLSACGGSDGEGGSSSSGSSNQSSGGTETVTIQPQGNQMKFQQTEFTVPADQTVELVLENTASSPSMQHNVVILNEEPSDEVFKRVGEAGVKAGSSEDYVPDDPAVLDATPIAKPGETVSVTFTTPSEPGEYGYICTYPGHWATMRGTMIVEG